LKIVFLTSRFPYPLTKGDKLRAYHQIRELGRYNDIYLISIIEEEPKKNDLEVIRKITSGLHIIRITPIDRYISLIKATASDIPFQNAWFYSPLIHEIINKLMADIKPDHIFCQLTRMAEYAKFQPYPKTLDYMDCFGLSMKRRSGIVKGLYSFIFRVEAQRMINYEEKIAENFNFLTIISQQDKDQLDFPEAKNIKVVSNGISDDFFNYNSEVEKLFDIVFVGNMSYLPNIESVEYLVKKILPLCEKDVKVLLSGTSPDHRVTRLASPQVTVTGWVEDIRTSYAKSKVFVAPMWSGTGQQNKILEAMAMGIPCITTKVVNNAIGATEMESILLAETPEQFSLCINKLLNDKNLYTNISKNSQSFVRQNFDWKQTGMILSSIFAQKYNQINVD